MKRSDAIEISNLAGTMVRDLQLFLSKRFHSILPPEWLTLLNGMEVNRGLIADKLLKLIDTN